MKILYVNKYFFAKGGAENSLFQTEKLLEGKGHETLFFSMHHPRNRKSVFERYFVSEVDYNHPTARQAFRAAGRLLYSLEARRKIDQLICDSKPDLAHLNNIYHQISPSIIHSLRRRNIPIVMTLRDYKVVCASYSMVVNERICEACQGGRYYQCFLKKCVKGSRSQSLLNTFEMYLHHSLLHIYDLVDVFISPSRFLKDKVRAMGFKGNVVHLPNFVDPAEFNPNYTSKERKICYVGRISREKGVATLISAVKGLDVKLEIIGEGPMREELQEYARREGIMNVVFPGYQTGVTLQDSIRSSMFTVIPSECYENNPRSVIEGFALGKPAVGARIGGIPELVRDGETGYTYSPFDVNDLAGKIRLLVNDSASIARMGRNARNFIELELNSEKHYEKLMEVYRSASDAHTC